MPSLTYVARNGISLEERLQSAADNLHKLITITGQTKSGKTVLVNTVLPRSEDGNIWLDGGGVSSEDDLWTSILQELGATNAVVLAEGVSSTKHANGDVSGGIGFLGIGAVIGVRPQLPTITQHSAHPAAFPL